MAAINTKKALVPKLRFKGFDDSWISKKLGDIGTTNGGLTYSPDDIVADQSKGTLVLRSSNIQDGMISFHDNVYVNCPITEKDLVKENDILLCVRNGSKSLIGKSLIIKKEQEGYAFGAFMAIYRSDYNPFIFHFFKSPKFFKQVHEHLGATINQITGKSLNSFKLHLPTLPEQQKIASFLSAVDDKIRQLTRKKELLEQYKKGVMQQLFSGKLRFKDDKGKAFPEWEEKLLSEIAARNSTKNKDNKINFVLTNSATRGIISQDDYFDREIANQNNLEGYYVVAVDDFVYNPRISVHAPVGPIKRNKLKEGVMSPLYSIFRFKVQSLEFFEFYFETKEWHTYLESVSNIGARHDRMNISNGDFFKMPIPFPCEDERKKIASFLINLSEKIESNNKVLTQTQTFKKGLLQQMFV